jgi:hypothetical protein
MSSAQASQAVLGTGDAADRLQVLSERVLLVYHQVAYWFDAHSGKELGATNALPASVETCRAVREPAYSTQLASDRLPRPPRPSGAPPELASVTPHAEPAQARVHAELTLDSGYGE